MCFHALTPLSLSLSLLTRSSPSPKPIVLPHAPCLHVSTFAEMMYLQLAEVVPNYECTLPNAPQLGDLQSWQEQLMQCDAMAGRNIEDACREKIHQAFIDAGETQYETEVSHSTLMPRNPCALNITSAKSCADGALFREVVSPAAIAVIITCACIV